VTAKQNDFSFWAKVKKGNGCWEWQGASNSTGYGTVAWHGRVYTAHRVAAWLSGLVDAPSAPKNKREPKHVLHRCDNRKCCNPEHFFLGSYSDNQKDAYLKNRRQQPKGEKHTNAKLTNKQVLEIRRRYTQGEYQVPLAKEYGVSQRVVSLVVRKESYK
jgi:hypothetical protein